MEKAEKFTTKIIFYNQKGQGVGFYQEKPVYLSHVIKGEVVAFEIIETKAKYFIGRVLEILEASSERITNLPTNYQQIGGYELIHMSQKAEKAFKIEKIINDFRQIAHYQLSPFEFCNGEKQFRYRNKLTLNDGGFMVPRTNQLIFLDDFLLTNIKPQTTRKGKIIFRQLNSLIIGRSDEQIYTTDTMFNLQFRVGISSFYQVNKEIAEIIYGDILQFINQNDFVLDLYSGIATIALIVAKRAKKVLGVEKNRQSFTDALYNIQFNKANNVEFYQNDVAKFLKQHNFVEIIDTIIVDPGRKGLANDVIDNLLKLAVNKIIYLSCNSATQAANFKKLSTKYQIIFVKAYNMFPQTYHIENLIVLQKFVN